MYKAIYLSLVVVHTVLLIVVSASGIDDTALGLWFTLFYGAILSGGILALVWGLWSKAGAWRVILATLLSLIPMIGPWIALSILIGKTPKYTGKLSKAFDISILWPIAWRVALVLFGLVLAGGGIANLVNYGQEGLMPALLGSALGLNLAVVCIASLFKAKWVRTDFLVPLLFLQAGLALVAIGLLVGIEIALRAMLCVCGAGAITISLGILLNAKWVARASITPLIFAFAGLMISVYGFLGANRTALMLFFGLEGTTEIASLLFMGIGGIIIAAVSLGHFFKAKWAKFIVGVVEVLIGLIYSSAVIYSLIADPLNLPARAILGDIRAIGAIVAGIGLGGGLIFMGYLNLEEVFKKKGEDVSQLSHFFICGGNQSLIEAYHDLFRVGAPAYGGSAAYYRADESQLDARAADPIAASLRFDGQKFMGLKAEEVATVAEALARLSGAIYRGVFISYVSVGSAGQDWVQKVHATILGQGILPYSMYTTASKDAAQFLLDSFSLVSAS